MTYLGIDGGGTKTVFLIADAELNELERLETGPSNWLSIGEGPARKAISDGISGLKHRPDVVCAGFAGAARPESAAFYASTLNSLLPGARVLIEPDAFIGYIGAIGVAPGALLIAGTGSIGIGRQADGTMVRIGGWGPQFGDEGSGFWIGREAIRAALAIADRREANSFVDVVAGSLGLASIYDIVSAWNSGKIAVPQVAALFPEVARFYPGEPAGRILTDAALHLRKLTDGILQVVNVQNCVKSLAGSVARHPLMRNLIGIDFMEPQHPPEWGAVIWAREKAQ
jgi:N-acetylglucosamine kinase-like BadF-type ATPase